MDLEQDQDESQPLEDGDTEIELESDIEYAFHQVLPIPESGYLADPCVLLVDGVWYLYGTHDAAALRYGIPRILPTGRKDRPSGHRRCLGIRRMPLGIVGSPCGACRGSYYLYYTANCRIGVARADSPLGPFEELYDHPLIGTALVVSVTGC